MRRILSTKRSWWLGAALILAAFACIITAPARAEEITLKDGRKITGTIVGFEKGMFRVQTDYGFVLVRKDRVSSVSMQSGAEKSGQVKPDAQNDQKSTAEKESAPAPSATAGAAVSANQTEAVKPVKSLARPSPPSISRPLDEPIPSQLKEHVEGTTYTNDTFHFSMFMPPEWKIYDGLPRDKVSAIVVLSTSDERTLLIVDRRVWSGLPDLKNDVVEENLRQMYSEYKKVSEADVQVDGRPGIRRTFTGALDGIEWHGVSARVVAQGNTVFGIVGLTSDDNYQFREAIFSKIIKSFHFLPSAEPTAAGQRMVNQ